MDILQTHRFGTGGYLSLREPSPPEVRAQQWMAIGEGATGIFWFLYSTEPGWTGLVDNPTLYPVVSDLAQRLGNLRGLLAGLRKVDDRFAVSGDESPYVSTLAGNGDGKVYAVVVNKGSCDSAQSLRVTSPMLGGRLSNVESGQTYALGEPISFEPGDGRTFELMNPSVRCDPGSGRYCTYLQVAMR